MFVKVPYTQLVEGKKYKIIGHYEEYTGIYAGIYPNQHFNLLFSNVKSTRNHNNVLFSNHKNFYAFVSHAQAAMERRAVTMIVRRLIGDDCFEW